jgi:hypothetical protein
MEQGGTEMRFLIDVQRTPDDRVEGVVLPEGGEVGSTFSGWMELLSLLEPPRTVAEPVSQPGAGTSSDTGAPTLSA